MELTKLIATAISNLLANDETDVNLLSKKSGLSSQRILAFEDGSAIPTLEEVDRIFSAADKNSVAYLYNIYRTEVLIAPGEQNTMLDKLLSKQVNKLTWLRLAIHVLQADKVINILERENLQKLFDQLQLTDKEKMVITDDITNPKSFINLKKELEIPDDIPLKKILVKKVMDAALFDNIIDPREEDVIKQIMSFLEIEDTTF